MLISSRSFCSVILKLLISKSTYGLERHTHTCFLRLIFESDRCWLERNNCYQNETNRLEHIATKIKGVIEKTLPAVSKNLDCFRNVSYFQMCFRQTGWLLQCYSVGHIGLNSACSTWRWSCLKILFLKSSQKQLLFLVFSRKDHKGCNHEEKLEQVTGVYGIC